MERQKKTFAVKLKGLAPWIQEVQYQKEEKDLTLLFTLTKDAEVNIIVEDGGIQNKRLTPLTPSLGLLSRKLISNVEYKPNWDLYITSVTKEELKGCGASTLALKGAVEELKQCGGENSSLLVLFEGDGGGRGLLWSKRKDVRERVKSFRPGKEKGNWMLFEAQTPVLFLRKTFKENL